MRKKKKTTEPQPVGFSIHQLNICVLKFQKEKKLRQNIYVFKEITAEKYPNLMENISLQIHGTH